MRIGLMLLLLRILVILFSTIENAVEIHKYCSDEAAKCLRPLVVKKPETVELSINLFVLSLLIK